MVIHDSVEVFEQIIIRAVISFGIAVGLIILVLSLIVIFFIHLVRSHWIEVECDDEDEDTPTLTGYSEAA